MARMIEYLPELEGDEGRYITKLMEPMSAEEADQFSTVYRARRKDPQTILLMAVIGFFGAAGIHRLVLGQIAMGILYFFTGGLCVIGTIVDLINHKNLTFEYNRDVAQEVLSLIK